MNNMPEKVVEIRQDLVSDFQRLGLLVQHHQQLAQQLRAELDKLVKIGHGIDLTEPGWMLDIVSGRVWHRSLEAPQLVKPEPEQAPEQEA